MSVGEVPRLRSGMASMWRQGIAVLVPKTVTPRAKPDSRRHNRAFEEDVPATRIWLRFHRHPSVFGLIPPSTRYPVRDCFRPSNRDARRTFFHLICAKVLATKTWVHRHVRKEIELGDMASSWANGVAGIRSDQPAAPAANLLQVLATSCFRFRFNRGLVMVRSGVGL